MAAEQGLATAVASPDAAKGQMGMVLILAVISAYAFVDRAILALLVEPIRQSLGVSDVQMSLLLGVAFAMFYAICNVPAGYLVDRVSRRGLIGIASVGWSGMTMYCGFAQNFTQLFVGRAGVGLAEAVITPASFSLIRDMVPIKKRGRAFSILAMSPIVGGSLSLLGGAFLVRAAQDGAFRGVPLIGAMEPWQAVLIIVGLLGLPLSLLLFLVPEKRRDQLKTASDGRTFPEAFKHLGQGISVYGPLIVYVTLAAMMAFSNSAWIPALFGRKFGLSPQELGPMLGLVSLTCGASGLFLGGLMMDWFTSKGRDIRLLGAIAITGAMIGYVAGPQAPSVPLALAFMGLAIFFAGLFFPIGAMTLAQITPAPLMGKVTAVYLLSQTLVSQALGPVFVALIAEGIFSGPLALANAMSVFQIGVGLCALASVFWLRRAMTKIRATDKIEAAKAAA